MGPFAVKAGGENSQYNFSVYYSSFSFDAINQLIVTGNFEKNMNVLIKGEFTDKRVKDLFYSKIDSHAESMSCYFYADEFIKNIEIIVKKGKSVIFSKKANPFEIQEKIRINLNYPIVFLDNRFDIRTGRQEKINITDIQDFYAHGSDDILYYFCIVKNKNVLEKISKEKKTTLKEIIRNSIYAIENNEIYKNHYFFLTQTQFLDKEQIEFLFDTGLKINKVISIVRDNFNRVQFNSRTPAFLVFDEKDRGFFTLNSNSLSPVGNRLKHYFIGDRSNFGFYTNEKLIILIYPIVLFLIYFLLKKNKKFFLFFSLVIVIIAITMIIQLKNTKNFSLIFQSDYNSIVHDKPVRYKVEKDETQIRIIPENGQTPLNLEYGFFINNINSYQIFDRMDEYKVLVFNTIPLIEFKDGKYRLKLDKEVEYWALK